MVIAKTLAGGSKIIIFDEPTRGIDVGAKHEIYKLMNELAEAGHSIIMVSSDMPEPHASYLQKGRWNTPLNCWPPYSI